MGSRGRLLARTLICHISQQPSTAASLLNNKVNIGQWWSFSRDVGTEGVESLDQETEKKAGWMLKALAAATFAYVGDSLVKHSVALLRTKDPLFRRNGASRLTLIATDDERRQKTVDAGGVGALVNMLKSASDDETRREAAKALASLSECDAAVEALHETGVQPFVSSLSTLSCDSEIQEQCKFDQKIGTAENKDKSVDYIKGYICGESLPMPNWTVPKDCRPALLEASAS